MPWPCGGWASHRISIHPSADRLAAIDHPKRVHGFLLGLPSVGLIVFWLIIAENHRAFQDKSFAVLKGLEERLKAKALSPKSDKEASDLNGLEEGWLKALSPKSDKKASGGLLRALVFGDFPTESKQAYRYSVPLTFVRFTGGYRP